MRKILHLLMLTALFLSCSSDDDKYPNNGNENNNGMIDENIIGKWKVEYSKTIYPAVYNEKTGNVEYEVDARISEYLGNYGEPNVVLESGMFSGKEVEIEITRDKKIVSSSVLEEPTTLIFDSMRNGLITKRIDYSDKIHKLKYRFEKEKLIIETITPEYKRYYYTISEYSKIK